MSIISFVLLVVALTFAIGLSVAAIIWGINQALSGSDHPNAPGYKNSLNEVMTAFRKLTNPLGKPEGSEDPENKELYIYHHGKN